MNRSLTFIANELNIQGTFYSDESLAAEVFKAITGLKGEIARLKEIPRGYPDCTSAIIHAMDQDKGEVLIKVMHANQELIAEQQKELSDLKGAYDSLNIAAVNQLNKFIEWKKLVHDTLDGIGVPKFESEQCRIKPRMELVKHLNDSFQKVLQESAEQQRAFQEILEVVDDSAVTGVSANRRVGEICLRYVEREQSAERS